MDTILRGFPDIVGTLIKVKCYRSSRNKKARAWKLKYILIKIPIKFNLQYILFTMIDFPRISKTTIH